MDRKPFEIVAECELPAFPTGADITRVSEQIEAARRSRPNVVQAAVNPPAIYKQKRYVLQTRLVVWAEDTTRALQAAQDLLAETAFPCRTALPSSRALVEADVPPPAEPVVSRQPTAAKRPPKPGRPTAARRRPAPGRAPRKRVSKGASRRGTGRPRPR